jgi:hypothetical protein
MTSEFNISFSGAGGHSHDGISSSRINTTSYSIFDFRTGVIGNDQSRIALQQTNKISFDNYIINLLNTKEFSPTLLKIKANSATGKIIVQGSLAADKLEPNMVLVKQQIQSNNFNGVISNNVITSNGTTGWAISSSGQAVFNNVTVRGTILANSGQIGGYLITGGALAANSTGGTEFANSWTSEITLDTSSRIITSTYYVDLINENGYHNYITFNDVERIEGGIRVQRDTYDMDFNTFITNVGYQYGATGPGSISDERLKNILNKEVDALSTLNKISIVPFTYKKDRLDSEKLGFIAQQLQTVLPDMVIVGGENPEQRPWTIIMEQIIPYLTKAIQELSGRNEQLEARLQALEGV